MRLVSPLSQVSDRPVEGRVRGWIVPMRARSAAELHRAATPLELFFDLVLVVAVVFAADALHEAVGEGHGGDALLSYVMVFFAIWWAWMSFSWFASAYDTDDVPYRLAVFLQMTGALILAAGVPRAFEEGDFAVAALGSGGDATGHSRPMATRSTFRPGETSNRNPHCGRYQRASGRLGTTGAGTRFDALVRLRGTDGRRAGSSHLGRSPTSWHAGHIAERYGLFTILVLGESVLAASVAIQSVADVSRFPLDLVVTNFVSASIAFQPYTRPLFVV